MFKDIRRLYLYAVCFATLLMMAFSVIHLSGVIVEALIPVANPYRAPYEAAPAVPGAGTPADQEKAKEEALKQMEAEQARQNAFDRRQRLVDLARTATTLLIAAPLYLYHWRVAQKDEKGTEA